MVKVKALGWIAEKIGFNEKVFRLKKPLKIIDFLPILTEIDDKYFIILVNNKPANKNTIVKDDDKIVIMPVVSGG